MIILVLNCGSSSIKYQLIDMNTDNEVLAKGQIERIGLAEGIMTHQAGENPKSKINQPFPDHTVGINKILEYLIDDEHGVIESLDKISAVGHRVAHGGEYFSDSAIIDADVISKIESCFELAPLHNPAHMKGIDAITAALPSVPQVATFDTSFHQTIKPVNYLYALPYRYYEVDHVRKYGFHGTSHKFVAEKTCEMTGLDFNNSRIITCHIGNGASITAIENGISVDTSMGFTPVDGLVMGTRSGNVDPSALVFIAKKNNLTIDELNDIINTESGVVGITGLSSDMRDIENAAAEGNTRAIIALDMYFARLTKFVGSYMVEMGGVDAIVFTGGVGENDSNLRKYVCEHLKFVGLKIDEQLNEGLRGKDTILSTDDSTVKVVLATTNEELVIASDTFRLLNK
ncbi:MAG: acetate kinase [Rikenellaceae bacterium]